MKGFEFEYDHLLERQATKSPFALINNQVVKASTRKPVDVSKLSDEDLEYITDMGWQQYLDQPQTKKSTTAASKISQGIKQAEKLPVPKITVGKQIDPVHDYTYYTAATDVDTPDQEDDEEETRAGSRVAHKAKEVSLGSFNENSILVNEQGEFLIVQGFFGFPMMSGAFHQIDKQAFGINLLSTLGSVFPIVSPQTVEKEINKIQQEFKPAVAKTQLLPAFGNKFPVVSRKTNKIDFQSSAVLRAAATAASKSLYTAFARTGHSLVLCEGKFPIHWVNSDEADKATSFSISHWIKTPNDDFPRQGDEQALKEYGKTVEHYLLGYYNTAGVPLTLGGDSIEYAKSMFGKFTVGMIEKHTGFISKGAKSLKRISAVRPATVLGLKGEYEGSEIEIFNQRVRGKTLKSRTAYSELSAAIREAYAKNPKKVEKLQTVTDEIIGTSPNAAVKFPQRFEGLTLADAGFSSNALAVDYMEVLHPLAMMKPSAVINNGIYDAAAAYLGTTDLSTCDVFFPDAENAALFDSALVKNGRVLMLSSKAGEGRAPVVTGLAAAFDALTNNNTLPIAIRREFTARNSANPGYSQLINFFNSMRRGISDQEVTEIVAAVTDNRARLVVREIEKFRKMSLGEERDAVGEQVAKKLNSMDNGDFIDYCEFVMSSTNLVQVNTQAVYGGADEFSTLTLEGFLATWPNRVFDQISFSYESGTLKFKIGVGLKTGADFSAFTGYDLRGKQTAQPRYASPTKFSGAIVPGTAELFSKKDKKDLTWVSVIKRLADYMKENDLLGDTKKIKIFRSRDLPNLNEKFVPIKRFMSKTGYNPGMETGTGITTRDLINKIEELLS